MLVGAASAAKEKEGRPKLLVENSFRGARDEGAGGCAWEDEGKAKLVGIFLGHQGRGSGGGEGGGCVSVCENGAGLVGESAEEETKLEAVLEEANGVLVQKVRVGLEDWRR